MAAFLRIVKNRVSRGAYTVLTYQDFFPVDYKQSQIGCRLRKSGQRSP